MGLFDSIITGPLGIVGGAFGKSIGGAVGSAMPGVMDPIRDNYNVPIPYSPDQISGVSANQAALAKAIQAQAVGGTGPVQQITQNAMDQAAQQGAVTNSQNRALNPGLAARLSGNQAMQGRALAASLGAQAQLASQGMVGNQNLEQENLMNNANLGSEKINAGVNQTNTETAGKVEGGMLGAGGAAAAAMAAAHGAMVPGKAQVRGDSPANDTVKAKLSPGEIVLPRSVTQSEDAGNKAKEFVESLKKQKASKEGKSGGYSKVLEAHRKLGEALKGLKAS